MKQLNYDGQSLVTGTAAADAIMEYAEAVARMTASKSVEVAVLEASGKIVQHSLLLTTGTALDTFDLDTTEPDEDERFPVPDLPPLGGRAVAASLEDFDGVGFPEID